MANKKIGLAVAGVVVAGGLIAAGPALASATGYLGSPQQAGTTGYGGYGMAGGEGGQGRMGGQGMHQHTAVTGAELAKVTAAIKAKDSAVTVTTVQKDPDGSYDVLGTKAGQNVRFEASADLTTISQGMAGGMGRGGHGGKGMGGGMGGQDTTVTGAEADKVKAAVTAKDSAITVTAVRKDPDGSYDALGTKAGQPVMVEVSKDLATVEVRTGMGGGMGGGRGMHGQDGQQGQTPGSGSTTAPSSGTATGSAASITF